MRTVIAMLALVALAGIPSDAGAHWCSNIYESGARLVVKPESSTVFPGMNPGDSTTLRVWVRNNFPYIITNAEMRASNADFTVTVTPDRQTLYPWQKAAFDLQITRVQATGDDALHLQIRVFQDTGHRDGTKIWRDEGNLWIDPQPSEGWLTGNMNGNGDAAQLSAARLSDLYTEQDGVDWMIALYGRPRLMYNNSGVWGEGAWFPDRELYKYDYKMLRSAVELARRQSNDPQVLPAMVAAMDDPNTLYRGTSALLAAHLGGGSGARARIETMATTDACLDADLCSHYTFDPSDDARTMAKAALLVLGEEQYRAEVEAALEDPNERVRMVVSTALGLLGDDNAVTTTLMPLAQDTADSAEVYLHGAYLLSLVASARRGPGDEGCVTFYNEVCDDPVAPRPPTNLRVD